MPAFDWSVHSDHCILLANHDTNVQSKDTIFDLNLGSDLGSDVRTLVRTLVRTFGPWFGRSDVSSLF